MTLPCAMILAGGKSRRLGGGDKCLLPLGDRPILAHVIERIAPQCAALALNANGDPGRFSAFGLPVIPDPLPGQPGPLAGVLAGLDWAAGLGHTTLLTVAADQPFLPPDLVARLSTGTTPVTCALSHGRHHWLTAVWQVDLRDRLHHALTRDGLARVEDFLSQSGWAAIDFGTAQPDPFFNVNSANDLATARTHFDIA